MQQDLTALLYTHMSDMQVWQRVLADFYRFDGAWPSKEMLSVVQEAIDKSELGQQQGACLRPPTFVTRIGRWFIVWQRRGAVQAESLFICCTGEHFNYTAWVQYMENLRLSVTQKEVCNDGNNQCGTVAADSAGNEDAVRGTAGAVRVVTGADTSELRVPCPAVDPVQRPHTVDAFTGDISDSAGDVA